ncbi:MAG: hypothetical protein J5379_05200 [Clostridiales bacterium]|nr:hypothetical protein [Clostridiales bacterium]
MKTRMRKIGALVISFAMLFALGSTVMAADDGDLAGDGVVGDFTTPDTPTVYNDVVFMYKEITAYNPETCTVNAPTITYNYTIGAGEAGKDIYDIKSAHNPEASVHATTKAGVGTPAISGSVDGTTFTAGQLVFTPSVKFDADADGEKNAYQLKLDFSSIDFTAAPATGAGVYRYVITETTDVTKANAGIKDGDISDTRYMDVYVDGNGDIYGYVCFQNNNSIDAQDGATTNTVTEAAKTEGFVATTAGGTDGATAQTADAYYTFNFDLTKELENDTYSQGHEFPFTITLANSSVTANVLPIVSTSGTGTVTQAALTPAPITGTWTPTISDGGVVSYVGIPCGTTVTIYETNDVTGVTYASVSTNADTNAAALNIYTGENSNNAIITCGQTALTAAAENHTASGAGAVTFTNSLKQISPTGVIVRYAPYILLLGAGAALFILSRHWKKKEETEA